MGHGSDESGSRYGRAIVDAVTNLRVTRNGGNLLTEYRFTSQEGLCSMQLVSSLLIVLSVCNKNQFNLKY